MNFNELFDDTEVDTTSERQAEVNSIMTELNKQARIQLKQHGVSLRTELVAHRVDSDGLTNSQYEMRYNLLQYICKHPELTDERYPLRMAWAKFTKEPWNDKISRYKLGKLDKSRLIEVLKDLGIAKSGVLQVPTDLVRIVKDHYSKQERIRMAKLIEEQNKTIEQYQFQLDTVNNNLQYKGITFRKVRREYVAEIYGIEFKVSMAATDKLAVAFKAIDSILASVEAETP